jgi:hypothetical protein
MNLDQAELAALAARWVVEEGLDYGSAKQRAGKALGQRGGWPDNLALEQAVRDYLALYCADTQPTELQALRQLALAWMERLAAFRPYLGGAVWRGTATRLSNIELALFCEDSKALEIELLNQRLRFDARSAVGATGREVPVLCVSDWCAPLQEEVGVFLTIYDYDELRGLGRADAQGRPWRGNTQDLRRLLQEQPS